MKTPKEIRDAIPDDAQYVAAVWRNADGSIGTSTNAGWLEVVSLLAPLQAVAQAHVHIQALAEFRKKMESAQKLILPQ